MKIDLHVHSCYSSDSSITPEEIPFYAREAGLDGVAVIDHDRLDGALKIAEETDFFIIPGMEIASAHGHIVGLNVREPIRNELSADETVDRIHEAKGIAVACHPTGFLKGGLGKHTSSKFDAVEVINSSALPFGYSVRRNQSIAIRLGKSQVAGSDAHYGPEIGCAYTLIDAELNADDVLKAIKNGFCKPFGQAIPFSLRLRRIVAQRLR